MYTIGEMSESQAKRVRIKEVDGWTLKMLIEYVYTAEIQVTEENVQVSGRIVSSSYNGMHDDTKNKEAFFFLLWR